jgi:hypothetical protein
MNCGKNLARPTARASVYEYLNHVNQIIKGWIAFHHHAAVPYQDQMPSILAKIGLTTRASFLNSQCWTNTASSQSLVRFFHPSQLWCKDNAAYNARQRERYANDPEYRQRQLQYRAKCYAKATAIRRPEHIQKYLNDKDYREFVHDKERNAKKDREAQRQADMIRYREDRNNYAQKLNLLNWILRSKWARRLVWETHNPLIAEDNKVPALCASCNHLYTRKLWWRRKTTDEKTGEQLLDCHKCFCDKDWKKALPLGYRGHVFGVGPRLKEPDWTNYPPPASSP